MMSLLYGEVFNKTYAFLEPFFRNMEVTERKVFFNHHFAAYSPELEFEPASGKFTTQVLVLFAGLTEVPRGRTLCNLIKIAEKAGGIQDIEQLQKAIQEQLAKVDNETPYNPYMELKPFTKDDKDKFFGRKKIIDEIIARITSRLSENRNTYANPHPRFISIIGPSGSGKSSLVMAGVLPQLQARVENKGWLYLEPMRLDNDWLESLKEQFKQLYRERQIEDTDNLITQLGEGHNLSRVLSKLISRNREDYCILFIDQLEEIFSPEIKEESRNQFIDIVINAAQHPYKDGGRFVVITTIRADFYDRFLSHPRLSILVQNHVPIIPMEVPELYAAIVEPARHAHFNIEPDLVSKLITELNKRPGTLPLMQFVLHQLYEQMRDRVITFETYLTIGEIEGALSNHATEKYKSLRLEQQQIAERLFLSLIGSSAGNVVRRRVTIDTLYFESFSSQQIQEIVGYFVSQTVRLLTADKHSYIEISHEILIEHWGLLKGWWQDNQDYIKLYEEWEKAVQDYTDGEKMPSYSNNYRRERWSDERIIKIRKALEKLGRQPGKEGELFNRLEWEYLRDTLAIGVQTHEERLKIGLRLWTIGDLRPGIYLDTLREAWCMVDAETPFYIAKYPVTLAQYRAFCEETRKPLPKGNHFDNYPLVNIKWQEAVDFCEWASKRSDIFPPGCDPKEWQIRLPSVEEWLRAMNGGDETRRFPWEGDWDANKCNTKESGLDQVIAVGMYPQGASPCGALDMFGNVWEWTATLAVGMENYVALACGYSSHHSYLESISNHPNSKSLDKNNFPDDFPIGFRLACCKS
jgi:energy-coupling factor transporter ATP-binding protein EcfA2